MVGKRMRLVVSLAAFALLSGCVRDELRRGELCLSLGDAQRAQTIFASVLDRSPDDKRARRGLGLAGIALARQKAEDGDDRPSDWSRAIRELSLADTVTDSVVREGLFAGRERWARSLVSHGDTLRAEEILEDLVIADPRRTGPRRSLAVLLARTGSVERAEDLFLQNAVIDSTDVDTWFNLGLLSWNAGRRLEATERFLRAERYAPTDPEVLWWVSKVTGETSR